MHFAYLLGHFCIDVKLELHINLHEVPSQLYMLEK